MMKIYKYPIEITDLQRVSMPVSAKILTAQIQGGACCLWAIVDENEWHKMRKIAIYGTGHPLPDYIGEYIATVQLHGGGLVFHVFEIPE